MAMLRGYLVDATYQWLVDHKFTPYLLVDTEYDGINVPKEYIDEDGKILFDISPNAIESYAIDDEKLSFDATFSGVFYNVTVPIEAILEIFAQETAQGLYAREFGYGITVNEGETDDDVNPPSIHDKHRGKGGLTLV